MTKCQEVYDRFFDLVTDDFYAELNDEEVEKDCRSLLMSSIPTFEFPKVPFTFTKVKELGEEVEYFEQDLTLEEINILAYGMVIIWTQRQTTTIELTRQKFSGKDFELTSQAAHLTTLLKLLKDAKEEHRRLQMLHSRRKINENGEYESTFSMLVTPVTPPNIKRRGVNTSRGKF